MSKIVFVDTNIVLDLLAKREPFYEFAAKLFSLADKNKIKILVSSLSFANIHYILSKQQNKEIAKEALRRIKILVKVIDLNEKILDLALNSEFEDFEDAIQYFSASNSKATIIVTRNIKDFTRSKIPVMTAEDCIKIIS
jgi:predicted nucleic acid-binding protein